MQVAHSRSIRWPLLLALLPLAQAILDRRWLFDGPGRDPWIYYGYFRFARIYLREGSDLYYSSRLPVILPGYLLRHLLPAIPANAVLHLALYGCALGALYLSASASAGRRAALLASLVLGGQPAFLRAIGSNYVSGFGITYFLLALAALTLAARRPPSPAWRALLAAAGAAAVAIVAANLFYAIYLPLLAAHYLALDRYGPRQSPAVGGRRNELMQAALWAGAGAGVELAGFAAMGRFWGHAPGFFLLSTIRWLWQFSQQPSIFKQPVARWLPIAGWLVFPLTVLGGSCAALFRERRARRQPRRPAPVPAEGAAGIAGDAAALRRFAQLQFVAFFAAMAAVELTQHGVTLEYAYYASLLLPPAALALAGQLAPLVEGLAPRRFAWLILGAWALLAVVGAAGMRLVPAGAAPTIVLPLALGAIAVAVIATGRQGLRAAILVVLFVVASQLVNRMPVRNAANLRPEYADTCRFFRQLDGALSALRQADPNLGVRLWYDNDDAASPFYDTLATAWRLCGRLVTYSFPDVAGGRMCDGQPLRPGMKVAVVSGRPPPESAAAAERALATIGLRARWLGVASIPGPVSPVTMSFFETVADR
jgi:hypothetical protein